MAENKQCANFKKTILLDLKRANEKSRSFRNIVQSCTALHETLDLLKNENHRLQVAATKLDRGRLNSQSSTDDTEDAKRLAFEKKIYELQKELSELHRNKGEHADKVIELRQSLDVRSKEMAQKNSELETVREALRQADETKLDLKDQARRAEQALELMNDEFHALKITYSSVANSKEKLEKEYEDLVSRWMAYKAKEASEMNAENDIRDKLKQVKLQKDMAEAIREPVLVRKGSETFKR